MTTARSARSDGRRVDAAFRPHPSVSIVGIGCRVPAAAGVAEFWRQLANTDTGAPHTGRLDHIDRFDNDWFGIPDHEAALMDPRQRLALEVAIEALDDAGIGYRARGSGAAVVFGACRSGHTAMQNTGHDAVTGSTGSFIANRLSSVLDLHGPSLALDSASSSAPTAIDLAVRLLADDAVPFAIVGGVHLNLRCGTYQTNMRDVDAENGFHLSEGSPTPFDAAAIDYPPSDECAVLVLQRTTDALCDDNRIYAEIAGYAGGANGRSNSLSTSNGHAQPDATRSGAAAAPRWSSSVGSDLGQLGPTTFTELVKAALSIHYGAIAPADNSRTERPPSSVGDDAHHDAPGPTEPVDWSRTPVSERRAEINSPGPGGSNGRVVLRGVAADPVQRGDEPPVLLPVTGRSRAELCAQADYFANQLDVGTGSAPSGALRAFGSAIARLVPGQARAVVIAKDRVDAIGRLRALAQGVADPGIFGPKEARRRGGVLFVFSGPGDRSSAMGRALAARYPAFAQAITAAADAVVAAGGPRLWTPRHGFAPAAVNGRNAAEFVQPAIFAYQIALTELLGSWGVRPDAVLGHGPGEIAAAAASGALSLADAARIVVQRSMFGATSAESTALALLEAAPAVAKTLVEPMRETVGIAAINSPRAVVVFGAPRSIDTLVRRAKRRQLFAQRIALDFAGHSPPITEVPPEFRTALADLAPQPPHIPLYSTTRRAESITSAVMNADYWAENASSTVELAAALDLAAADRCSTVVEIAPHPMLLPMIREYPGLAGAAYPAVTRDDETGTLLATLAQLHTDGRQLEWTAHGPLGAAPPRRRWNRRHFPLSTPDRAEPRTMDESSFPADDLTDHLVRGVPTVPAAHWLLRLLQLACSAANGAATMVADFVVHDHAALAELPDLTYHRAHIGAESLRVGVTGAGTLASARPAGDPTPADIVAWMRVVDANRAARHRMRELARDDFYAALRKRHLVYGPAFRPLRSIAAGRHRALGTFDAAPLDRSATLDGCLHLLTAACQDELPIGALPMPIGIESAWVSMEPGRVLVEAHAFVHEQTATGLTGGVIGTDQHGAPVLALSGIRVRFTEPGRAIRDVRTDPTGCLVPSLFRQETWVPIPDPVSTPPKNYSTKKPGAEHYSARRALVVGTSNLAFRLAREIEHILPTERITREPDAAGSIVAAVLAGRTSAARVAMVVVWSDEHSHGLGDGVDVALLGRIVEMLQCIQSSTATVSLTVVLPESPAPDGTDQLRDPRRTSTIHALAGLVRSLQLESTRAVQLVWANDSSANAAVLGRLVAALGPSVAGRGPLVAARGRPAAEPAGADPDEVALFAGALAVRRFTTARATYRPPPIDPDGTYVVTGGLGRRGSVAVRWLLDAGARDVVVLTRAPRQVPTLLEGQEDRLVVVRCDAADRSELDNALNDIRECGSTIRGIVHAAGALEDAPFGAITTAHLTRMFAPKATAAGNLLELTAADPTDFVLLFSATAGALGAPGRAAYAGANAALDALAAAYPHRRILSVGWGDPTSPVIENGSGAIYSGPAGECYADLLSEVLRYAGPYLLTVDVPPVTDNSPIAARRRQLLPAEPTPLPRT